MVVLMSRTNLSRCPSNDLPTSLQPTHLRLLELLRERGEQCELDRQLDFESQSLSILMRQSQEWRQLERVTTPSIQELRRGNVATRNAVNELSALRSRLWLEASMCCPSYPVVFQDQIASLTLLLRRDLADA